MVLMQGRMALALGLSTVAHVGIVWMVGERVASSAAPAQRAVTVAMVPAAPRQVLNSIAPSATAALSPAAVTPIEPSAVRVIDEPDSVVAARVADSVEVLDAPLVQTRAPERARRLRDASSAVITAVTTRSDMRVAKAAQRDAVDKPLPADLRPSPATSARASPDATARRPVEPAPAREAVAGEPGAGHDAHAAVAVAGRPGADRSARPAAGNAPPDYPWAARVQGHEGRVVLSVWVSARGEADALEVAHSSGYPMLDRAAAEAVERWRFQPARRGGTETASMLYVPIVFRLDD